ncbi:MAG: CHASE2 domain-containing protein [Candidatus Competibacteraceae bacterium]|nr:CHASE2 domain-containing protein [Candidatus Competibacteraceae bacterium]MBK7982227.1 CHASE2 domain-containing protein [Candidatus Competibacteraceae bacterium]MBK8899222.1 CHASE2 domain-containing protein [Candidatus Competibacteraceae bacterium]MBK8963261.1 CHASE2 domain-containing protein [Candidatus Competibacteraceae bacterium]MBK9952222.1 CHASE2 domain-containing protein [Candidatus Competibacteraceae bacterium]
MSLISRPMARSLLTTIIAAGLTLVIANLSFFSLIELKGLDLLFTLRGVRPPPSQIVIVAIDELSLAEIKRQWPWPRSTHARLIRQLAEAGAKVVGLDILFAEPSESQEDNELEQAIQETGNVVLVSALGVVNDPLFHLTTRIDPLPVLAKVAAVGSPIITVDADGVVRRSRLLSPGLSSFALQVVGKYLSAPERNVLSKQDFYKELLIDYRGPPRTITTVSYYQALDYKRLLPPGIFEDKIVLVGRSLETIPEAQHLSGDTFFTPFSWVSSNATAGVEIQATLISNLLEGSFVKELSKLSHTILIVAVTLLSGLILVVSRPIVSLLAMVAITAVLCVIAHVIFTAFTVWVPIVSGALGIMLVYGGHLLARSLGMEQERRRTLEEANRTLEAKITERTQELTDVNQQLTNRNQQLEVAYKDLARTQEQLIHSEKMASLGLLVAGIAHELNNPISFVHNNLEFIEEYIERLSKIVLAYSNLDGLNGQKRRHGDKQKEIAKFDTIEKTLQELIASCRTGADRVKQIVLDLRTFSRTDDLGLVMADLQSGIESSLNLLSREHKDRITIHREYNSLPLVECYAGQINQVFMNLLQNAAQAIPERGQVWIKTESFSDWVRVAIKDTGKGIPAKDLERIFDPFFTTKPIGEGTGLGLSISYGIVEKHGGRITVASALGEGTEFAVELPVHMSRKIA